MELTDLVFERFGERLTQTNSRAILQILTAGPTTDLIKPRSTGARIENVKRSVADAFLRGLAKVDAERLLLRFKVGLDVLPGPAPDDLMPPARARALITSLLDDEELGGLARAARRLIGAVHLPHHVSEQQDLPLGGVSDLANRGDLDRLLLSELAHDDLTLAVRVAIKEALYLRRESPPRIPPSGRALLIDTCPLQPTTRVHEVCWSPRTARILPKHLLDAIRMASVAAGSIFRSTPWLSQNSQNPRWKSYLRERTSYTCGIRQRAW